VILTVLTSRVVREPNGEGLGGHVHYIPLALAKAVEERIHTRCAGHRHISGAEEGGSEEVFKTVLPVLRGPLRTWSARVGTAWTGEQPGPRCLRCFVTKKGG